jgi:hypothetical protein
MSSDSVQARVRVHRNVGVFRDFGQLRLQPACLKPQFFL